MYESYTRPKIKNTLISILVSIVQKLELKVLNLFCKLYQFYILKLHEFAVLKILVMNCNLTSIAYRCEKNFQLGETVFNSKIYKICTVDCMNKLDKYFEHDLKHYT